MAKLDAALLKEIMELGGSKDDLNLLNGVESDDDMVTENNGPAADAVRSSTGILTSRRSDRNYKNSCNPLA
jgi:hypothetical protein